MPGPLLTAVPAPCSLLLCSEIGNMLIFAIVAAVKTAGWLLVPKLSPCLPLSLQHSLPPSCYHHLPLISVHWQEKWDNHSQLLNIIILKFNSLVLLILLGNIFPHCPAFEAIHRLNFSSIDLPERSMLHLFLKMSVLWLESGHTLKYSPWDFPRAQAIFHRISLLLSQHRYNSGYLQPIGQQLKLGHGPLICFCWRGEWACV